MTGQPKKPKRLGQPIPWTDQQLEAMADISESDRQAAQVVWKTNAPRGFENLLEAKVLEEGRTDEQV
jgi:hypothetical protein